MKSVRWAAVAATTLIALMNLPVAFDDLDHLRTWFRWVVTLVGVAGLVAAAGLAARQPWGRPAVLAIGALNLAGATVAVAKGWEGGVIGLVVSALALGLGYLADDRRQVVPARS